MKTALTIAGSDSSGGAGIQADIKTMTMNGVYAMSAVTALTAQNTVGVTGIQESTPDFLAEQLDEIFTDIYPDAVKVGMVASSELISTIARKLQEYEAKNLVVDPVMVSTSGTPLISEEAIDTLQEELLTIADIITPNIPEAEVLADIEINSEEDMEKAAEKLHRMYGCAVLVKGGHNLSDANDLLYADGNATWVRGVRIENSNTHGTGCTLSSAIAANLAKGYDLKQSVRRAKDYISGALDARLNLGAGQGPMNHAFNLTGKFAESAEDIIARAGTTPPSEENATDFMLELLEDSLPLWDAAANCKFLNELGEDTLDEQLFYDYMVQDSIYLRDYLKIFAYAIAKSPTWKDMQLFNEMLAYCDDGENQTRLHFLSEIGMTDADVDTTPMKPACDAYCAFLQEVGQTGTLPEIIMAMLPCMMGYHYVFERLVERYPSVQESRFGALVADYVNPDYQNYCDYWYGITNEKCACLDPATREHLKGIFRTASQHELSFWQMAGGEI